MLRRLARLHRARRAPDVHGRQRLLLAHRLSSDAAGRDRGAPRRGRHPHLGARAGRVLPQLHRRVRRAVAPAGPAAAAARRHSASSPRASICLPTTGACRSSADPRAAFIFEGIGMDETIGDFGLIGGGAAGLELDIADPTLGTPPHALVVASLGGATPTPISLVNEEVCRSPRRTRWARHNPRCAPTSCSSRPPTAARCSRPARSPGAAALAHNGYDNNVARITGNVLRRFAADEPF